MKNGHRGVQLVGYPLGSDAPASRLATMSDKTRNTLLILGFGVSAALMFVTIYPRRQQ